MLGFDFLKTSTIRISRARCRSSGGAGNISLSTWVSATSLHTAGRQPPGTLRNVYKPFHSVRLHRHLAWCGMELRLCGGCTTVFSLSSSASVSGRCLTGCRERWHEGIRCLWCCSAGYFVPRRNAARGDKVCCLDVQLRQHRPGAGVAAA